jgi:hypothetical protein
MSPGGRARTEDTGGTEDWDRVTGNSLFNFLNNSFSLTNKIFLTSVSSVPHRVLRASSSSKRYLLLIAIVMSGCVSTPPYVYHYIPGRTATLENGYAVAPSAAPLAVRVAVEAGNELVGKPYRYGGGHQNFYDTAYDCSGAVSFVLHSIGRMNTPTPSKVLRSYAEDGPGRWITVYASRGHSFIVVAGLRFDTGYSAGEHGPQWLTRSRPADEFVTRHPSGL